MERCAMCNGEFTKDGIGTGYGERGGKKYCYKCCAELEKRDLLGLIDGESYCLYLTNNEVTNWCGTLRIKPHHIRDGHHNIAGVRTDVWFSFGGKEFHGVQYGYDSEICHIKAIKTRR